MKAVIRTRLYFHLIAVLTRQEHLFIMGKRMGVFSLMVCSLVSSIALIEKCKCQNHTDAKIQSFFSHNPSVLSARQSTTPPANHTISETVLSAVG